MATRKPLDLGALADKIAESLYVHGAQRLQLRAANERDLGGWCLVAASAQILEVLLEELTPLCAFPLAKHREVVVRIDLGPPPAPDETRGDAIKRRRKALGWTVERLAGEARVVMADLRAIEAGRDVPFALLMLEATLTRAEKERGGAQP